MPNFRESEVKPVHSETLATSLVAETPEVVKMREAIRSNNRTYLFWYEKAQNAEDNHKYNPQDPSDLPEIVCIVRDGTRINYDILAKSGQTPVRVEIINKINGRGLDPYDMADIAHRSGEGTKGQHGRGSKIADTAALVERAIGGVDYMSMAVDAGGKTYAWKGRGAMRINEGNGSGYQLQKTPRFVIDLDILPKVLRETVIGVDEPNEGLIEGLKTFGLNFLSANPAYEHSKFKITEGTRVIPNLLTVYATRASNGSGGDLIFSDDDLGRINLPEVETEKNPPRVEILADELIGRDPGDSTTKDVFEGGLRLSGGYYGYALNWSFVGFSRAAMGFNVARSNDSSYLVGSGSSLIALALKNCNNPEVFEKIFNVSIIHDETCAETQMHPNLFFNQMPQATERAIRSAWLKTAKDLGVSGEVFVTTDPSIRKRVEDEGKRVILVNSPIIARTLTGIVGLKRAEDAIGIKEVPVPTPGLTEKSLVDPSLHTASAKMNLIKFCKESGAIFTFSKEGLTIRFSDADLTRFRGEYGDLPFTLKDFLEDYLAAGGICRVVSGGTLFEFETIRGEAKIQIRPKKGTTKWSSDGIEVQMLAQKQNNALAAISTGIKQEFGKYLQTDGTIDWDRYYAEKLSQREALDLQLTKKQRELERLSQELEGKAGRQKERRMKIHRLSEEVRERLNWTNATKVIMAAEILGGIFLGREAAPIVSQYIPAPIVRSLRDAMSSIPGINRLAAVVGKDQRLITAGGVVIPDIENRLPDSLDANTELMPPLDVAAIIQLPAKYFNNSRAENIGYFPIENFLNTDNKGLGAHPELMRPFENTRIVSSLDGIVASNNPDHLIYRPNFRYQSLYPPVGWKITGIYQVGGAIPSSNASGALFWRNESELPKDMIVVAEKVKEQHLENGISSRIRYFKGMSPLGEYAPNFDSKRVEAINALLAGDSYLQKLHSYGINMMEGWEATGKNREVVSRHVLDTLNELAKYSDTKNYGFNFQIDKKGTGYDALVSIANQKDGKYFCSVASNVAVEWLKSFGIYASTVPGNTLYDINGVLMADAAHQTARAYLPNGDVLEIDLTPNVTNQTDQEVKNWLRTAKSSIEEKANLQEQQELWRAIENTAGKTGLPLLIIAASLFALKKAYPHLKQKEARRRIERGIMHNSVSALEQSLITSVAQRLTELEGRNETVFQREAEKYVDMLGQFDMRKQGLALNWLTQEDSGRQFAFSGGELASARLLFAKLAIAYGQRQPDVLERFDPVLRADFLAAAQRLRYEDQNSEYFEQTVQRLIENVPPAFSELYGFLDLINSSYQRTNSQRTLNEDTISRIIAKKVEKDMIIGGRRRVLNAAYQELTGRNLVASFERRNKK